MIETSAVTLDEQLAVCDTVVRALRSQLDMTQLLVQFPIPQQLEAIRFMEFLSDGEILFAEEPGLGGALKVPTQA